MRDGRYWRRRYRRLVKALERGGAVAKVKMQRPDGSWAFGIFIPFTREELQAERERRTRVLSRPTSPLAGRRGRDGTTAGGKRRP